MTYLARQQSFPAPAYRNTVLVHHVERLPHTEFEAGERKDKFENGMPLGRAMSRLVIDVKNKPRVLPENFYFANAASECIENRNRFDQLDRLPAHITSHDFPDPVHACHRAARHHYTHQTLSLDTHFSSNECGGKSRDESIWDNDLSAILTGVQTPARGTEVRQ